MAQIHDKLMVSRLQLNDPGTCTLIKLKGKLRGVHLLCITIFLLIGFLMCVVFMIHHHRKKDNRLIYINVCGFSKAFKYILIIPTL